MVSLRRRHRDVDADGRSTNTAHIPQRRTPTEPSTTESPPGGPSSSGGIAESQHPRTQRWRARLRWALAAVAVLVLAAASIEIAVNADRTPVAPPTGPGAEGPVGKEAPVGGRSPIAALDGLSGPPTLFGRVRTVLDPATAVVEVDQRLITVSVVGVDITDTPPCAQQDAAAFARRTLSGQTVTLVPDPTLPTDRALPTDRDAGTWPAYLVLDTQQSYTDAAIRAGWVSAGQGRYRPGFLTGQQQARDTDAGMWGPPCNRPNPS